LHNGQLVMTGETFDLHADMVLRAIGQSFVGSATPALTLHKGRILTHAEGRTTQTGVWAGGDCRYGGRDLTVEAVEHGTVAAQSIHQYLSSAQGA
jgi:dihydropyrimidine dehydrogenase (NAD+) subunit PreT